MDFSAALDAIYVALTNNSQAMAGRLVDTGRSLLFAIGSMILVWKMVRVMLHPNGPAPVIAEVVSFCFTFGLLLYFLNNWSYVFFDSFAAGFDFLAAKISGGSSTASGIALGATSLLKIVQRLWESSPTDATNPVSVITNLPSFILGSLFRLAIMLVMLGIGAVYASLLMLSQVLLTIGGTFLPVFLPFFLIEPLSWIATGAVRFAFVAGLYKVVGIFVISLIGPVIPTLELIASSSQNMRAVDVAAMAALLVASLVLLFLAISIPAIANGLASGHVSTSFRVPQVPKAGGDKAAGKD